MSGKSKFRTFLRWGLIASVLGLIVLSIPTVWVWNHLPDLHDLSLSTLESPLRVYSSDNKLIGVFGEVRRETIAIDQFPKPMINAILSAEDDAFYEHSGVDAKGMLRALYYVLRDQRYSQGGSTITMQVARNNYLNKEKSLSRKFKEILLAWKIEHKLSKSKILEIYLNKIYLGNRAYGFAAAAQVYYGSTLDQLNVSQLAMLAGLPQAPSSANPIANVKRAVRRRNYVLHRMRNLNYLDDQAFDTALNFEDNAKLHGLAIELSAPHVAEMARLSMERLYGDNAYRQGYKVYTSIDSKMQAISSASLNKRLREYDIRQGFRGAVNHIDLSELNSEETWLAELSNYQAAANLVPVLVVSVDSGIKVFTQQGQSLYLIDSNRVEGFAGIETDPAPFQFTDVNLQPGDIVYAEIKEEGARLAQIPEAQAAFVSIDPDTGRIISLVGGHAYSNGRFNRVTQARRQPGSSFKPFIYSAALENGYTAATLVNDAPLVKEVADDVDWMPDNDGSRFLGPIRLRYALAKSRNVVAIRVLEQIGLDAALDHIKRFGFDVEHFPRNLTLALGSSEITPLELARGYTVFANGGYLVEPYLIDRIEDQQGDVLFQNHPITVCGQCADNDTELSQADVFPRVISPENAYIMYSMMKDVIGYGTGQRAKVLNREDLAGKTGTSNEQKDAWFAGFHPSLVAVAWVGYDNPKTLGPGEFGGRTALPIWIDVMRQAVDKKPEYQAQLPENMVNVKVDAKSGLLACSGASNVIFETFRADHLPDKANCQSTGISEIWF